MDSLATPKQKRRKRKTRKRVKIANWFARGLITLGGIGTIIAVCTVCLFLFWVAAPLFLPASATAQKPVKTASSDLQPLRIGMDDYQRLGWALYPGGLLQTFRLDQGSVLEKRTLFDNVVPTAVAFSLSGREAAFGFEDGSIRLAEIGFDSELKDAATLPEEFRSWTAPQSAEFDGGLLSRNAEGQFSLQKLSVKIQDPIPSTSPSPVVLMDYTVRGGSPTLCILNGDGRLMLREVRTKKNLMTGKQTAQVTDAEIPLDSSKRGRPDFLLISGLGDNVYAAWKNGELVRFDTRDLKNPQLAEHVSMLNNPKASLTALGFLLGKTTIVAGDSTGDVRAWFRIKPAEAETSDGAVLAAAHEMSDGKTAVTSIAASARSRIVAAGYADGAVRLFHVTSEEMLVDLKAAEAGDKASHPVTAVAISPKDDGLLASTTTGMARWDIDLKHPEAAMRALLRPVWYEGYEKPEHVWQSTGGSDDFEPKLGVMPLVFGTLKATFYSMIFGIPLALLAAIYTSEFLHPRAKSKIKPAIELMASLPSVVLGFLAALVIAPYAERIVPEILTGFFIVPLTLLLGACAWQLIPRPTALRMARFRLLFIAAALPVAALWTRLLAPAVERLMFAGDIKMWLDGQIGSGTGGWFFLFLPLSATAAAVFVSRAVTPLVRKRSRNFSSNRRSLAELVKFLFGLCLTGVIALTLSLFFNQIGFDPRGTFVGTYVQRNALIVGFVMGFAVIPIIYTIAEDALATVPAHLRSASLAAGATPWQTAVRVIIPTAMSGLFSAVMVGLGRAVGETMIVLMAAGNTPVMDMNMFNGFRTLSANIAVELPEAVRNSTHYRTLFLAALALFLITFVLNTVAEMVRQRFRKRAYQL